MPKDDGQTTHPLWVEYYTQTELADVACVLDLRFNDLSLLGLALGSSTGRRGPGVVKLHSRDNLLVLIGNRAIQSAVREETISRYPFWSPQRVKVFGDLLMEEEHLAEIARTVGLSRWLVEVRERGENLNSQSLSDAVKSLIGALYLDRGHSACREFVARVMGDTFDSPESTGSIDFRPRSRLHGFTLIHFLTTPRYREVRSGKSDGSGTYAVVVEVNGRVLGTGKGRTFSEASTEAARQALSYLRH